MAATALVAATDAAMPTESKSAASQPNESDASTAAAPGAPDHRLRAKTHDSGRGRGSGSASTQIVAVAVGGSRSRQRPVPPLPEPWAVDRLRSRKRLKLKATVKEDLEVHATPRRSTKRRGGAALAARHGKLASGRPAGARRLSGSHRRISLCVKNTEPEIADDECVCDECYPPDGTSGSPPSLEGWRWKCAVCKDYDLCTSCVMRTAHPVGHVFVSAVPPGGKAVQLSFCDMPSLQCIAPAGSVHESIICRACSGTIVGLRFKCAVCSSFNLCEPCFRAGEPTEPEKHGEHDDQTHAWFLIRAPIARPERDRFGSLGRYISEPALGGKAGLALEQQGSSVVPAKTKSTRKQTGARASGDVEANVAITSERQRR